MIDSCSSIFMFVGFFCILYCSLCLPFMLYFFGLVDVVVVNVIVIG